MSPPNTIVRVAAVQAEPVWFDLAGSVAKACKLIAEAAHGGASLVAFPECFVPGFPIWIFARPVDTPLTIKYMRNCLKVDSPEMTTICEAAKENGINVVLGFAENDNNSLYIAQATISGQTGEILMTRRKIKPTHMERTILAKAAATR